MHVLRSAPVSVQPWDWRAARRPAVFFWPLRSASPSGFQVQGFTLTENALAIGLVAVLALPLLGVLTLGAKGSWAAAFRMDATLLANRVMGELRGEFPETAGPLAKLADRMLAGAQEESLRAVFDDRLEYLREVGRAEFVAGVVDGEGGEGAPYCLMEIALRRRGARAGGINGPGAPAHCLVSLRFTGPASAPLPRRQEERFATEILLQEYRTKARQ